MSIYEDLNNMNMNLDHIAAANLSEYEKRKWQKRVLMKIGKQRPSRLKPYLGFTAAVAITAGITIGSGAVTLADIPYMGSIVENFVGRDEPVDFSAYKTVIGDTAENEYGKLTLNEVLLDTGRLIMSSTYEPAEGVKFHYKMHPMPKVLVNGQYLTTTTSGQSIEVHESLFSVYDSVELNNIQLGEVIRIHIEYDHLDFEMPMEQPWIFDLEIPTQTIASSSETILFDEVIELGQDQTIRLEKMIITPVSAVLYYDSSPELLAETNDIAFKIISESGLEILPNLVRHELGRSFIRYEATLDLQSDQYYLVPHERPFEQTSGLVVVPEAAIRINPQHE